MRTIIFFALAALAIGWALDFTVWMMAVSVGPFYAHVFRMSTTFFMAGAVLGWFYIKL